ncbi:DUF4253 domain-containing protein [Streptomyces sp. NPDC002643]
MATLPNPLPGLGADPAGRSLGLERPLPPGRLIDTTDDGPWHEPLLWYADEPPAPGAWAAVQPVRRTAGLLPVLLDVGGGQGGPEDWELIPGEASYPGDHDADEVLAELWEQYADEDDDGEWPGLAPALTSGTDPDTLAAEAAEALSGAGAVSGIRAVDALLDGPSWLKDPRLALVPARRSADIPAAIGWSGTVNHEEAGRMSAVLRSWEDRFGIRVVALGFNQLTVSVAAPPTTEDEAREITLEHFAFCPDAIVQGPASGSLTDYAITLLNERTWTFWWD